MRRWRKIVLVALGVSAVAGAVFLVPTLWFKPWSIDHFYARVWLQFALKRPMVLSSLRILEPMGINFHSDDLDDMSVEFQVEEAHRLDRQLEILRSYDRERMSASQQLSRDALEWFLADQQEGNRFMFHDYPVNQVGGVQSSLPDFMINTHQINKPRDAEDYIKRVSKFGVALDQVIGGLKERERRKIVPPRFVIQRVLVEVRSFKGVPAKENALYRHFEKAVGGLAGLEPSSRDDLLRHLENGIERVVYPAYGRLADYLAYLEPIASTEDGVWRLPDGDAYYAHCLRSSTTTEMSAEEVHQLGLREVARLQDEMRAILKSKGYAAADPGAAMIRLNEEKRFLYPDTDQGRAQILADYQKIIDGIDRGLDGLFDVRPKVGVKVERVPEFKQATAPGAYYQQPPFDGSKPGTFFVNLRNVKEIPTFGMRTLAYHEAIPGHHFQIAIAQGLDNLPFFRRILPFGAYAEGWALYSEQLAAENGFEDDPYDRLGYLTGQLLRAVRLVVDTGIHSKRWTRERAIDYMLKNTGMVESDVVAEVERYIVWPGQACAYKVGQIKILDLRSKAMARLGKGFDIRGFHNVVLTNGALPLDILERAVDGWIASREQAPPGSAGARSAAPRTDG